MIESDPYMANKLSNAAMRATRIRAEMKEKAMGVLPPPKVSTILLSLIFLLRVVLILHPTQEPA